MQYRLALSILHPAENGQLVEALPQIVEAHREEALVLVDGKCKGAALRASELAVALFENAKSTKFANQLQTTALPYSKGKTK